jgi:outer membrane protein TolC
MLAASGARAEPSTLKEFLDAAETGNIDRRLTVEQVNKAHADFVQTWTSLLPSFTAQGTWTDNQYAASIPQTLFNPLADPTAQIVLVAKDQFDGAFRFDLPIINASLWLRAAALGDSEEAAKARGELTRDNVKRQIVGSFYSYAASLSLRESAQKSYDVAKRQLDLTEIRVKAGAVTELDLLRARAEAQRNRQTVADTEAAVAISRRTLQTLSGVTPADVVVMPPDDMHVDQPFAELEKNLYLLPSIHAADRDEAVASDLRYAARLALVPTVGFQFTERLTNAASFTGKATSYALGATVTWRLDVPTFFGIAGADANSNMAALQGERARLNAKDQIHGDWQQLNSALIKVEAAQAQVEAAQRAAQVSRDRYEVGAATQIDVIQAERDLFSAEVGQIQARTTLATARASLRLSSGQPIQ